MHFVLIGVALWLQISFAAAAEYVRISSLYCESHGLVQVPRKECEQAATSLNLIDTHMYAPGWTTLAPGCIYRNNPDFLVYGLETSTAPCGSQHLGQTHDCLCKRAPWDTQTAAEYVYISSLSCESHGLVQVARKECEQAATWLNLADKVMFARGETGQPRGCIYGSTASGTENSLVYGLWTSNTPCGSDYFGRRTYDCLCKRAVPTEYPTQQATNPPIDPREYMKIHSRADCCRSNGAYVGFVGNRGANTPDVCEAACDANSECKYFSHSYTWKNCALCSKCDFTTSGNGARYTSWKVSAMVSEKIHSSADCCRSNGAVVGSVGNRGANTPDVCEAACNANSECKYFSHSYTWQNCALCSKCDFTTSGNGARYTSWKLPDPRGRRRPDVEFQMIAPMLLEEEEEAELEGDQLEEGWYFHDEGEEERYFLDDAELEEGEYFLDEGEPEEDQP